MICWGPSRSVGDRLEDRERSRCSTITCVGGRGERLGERVRERDRGGGTTIMSPGRRLGLPALLGSAGGGMMIAWGALGS